ncbi:MAG: hypothetical protein WAR37_00130 [Candidatus Microsaccharimonas sp.]
MLVGTAIDVVMNVQSEVRALLMERLRADKDFVLLEVTAADLDCVKQSLSDLTGLERSEVVRNLRDVFRDIPDLPHNYPSSGREYPWPQYFYFATEASDTQIFRVYAALKRPGLLDALISGTTEKIWGVMRRAEIDTLETVFYPPLAMCDLYVPAAADIYHRHILEEVTANLKGLSVKVQKTPDAGPYGFVCQRVG